MADLYCQKCGEPWEFFYVEQEMPPRERGKFHHGDGCPACEWGKKAPEHKPQRALFAQAAEEIMGSDVDGIAASMEDAELMFGEEFWRE